MYGTMKYTSSRCKTDSRDKELDPDRLSLRGKWQNPLDDTIARIGHPAPLGPKSIEYLYPPPNRHYTKGHMEVLTNQTSLTAPSGTLIPNHNLPFYFSSMSATQQVNILERDVDRIE